jgi:hypothetical protein
MIKYTKNNLKKMEQFLTDNNYRIIYEKGQFKSGYCIVNNSNIIVVNKFFDVEGRINALQEIIPQLELSEGIFTN